MKILCLLAVLYTSIVLSTSYTPPINSDVIQAVIAELQKIQENEPEAPIPDESTRQVTQQSSSTVGGTVYTRWGSSECPGYAELVYSGLTAGKWYSYSGAGANYLCLPEDPQYLDTRSGAQRYSTIYGTEYEEPLKGQDDSKAPCAVCSTYRSISVMIPAKHTCPSSWTQENRGYLMAERDSYSSSMYVCVDEAMEALPGSQANTDGALLYHVEAACGYGLPCPPYDRTKELACVVCTSN